MALLRSLHCFLGWRGLPRQLSFTNTHTHKHSPGIIPVTGAIFIPMPGHLKFLFSGKWMMWMWMWKWKWKWSAGHADHHVAGDYLVVVVQRLVALDARREAHMHPVAVLRGMHHVHNGPAEGEVLQHHGAGSGRESEDGDPEVGQAGVASRCARSRNSWRGSGAQRRAQGPHGGVDGIGCPGREGIVGMVAALDALVALVRRLHLQQAEMPLLRRGGLIPQRVEKSLRGRSRLVVTVRVGVAGRGVGANCRLGDIVASLAAAEQSAGVQGGAVELVGTAAARRGGWGRCAYSLWRIRAIHAAKLTETDIVATGLRR